MFSHGTLKNVTLGLSEVVNELIKALYLAENISEATISFEAEVCIQGI